MKILFYINILSGGGAERVIANLSTQFAEDNYDVILVTTFATPNEYEISNKIIRVNLEKPAKETSNRILKNICRIKALRRTIKKYNPDVVISFMEEPNFRSIIATRGLNVKSIVSVRNDPTKEYAGKTGRWIANRLMPKADGCVFQTRDAKKFFPTELQEKSTIIFNSVKKDFYSIARKPIRGKIVTVGRISGQKNQKMLINAFFQLADQYPFATLDIYGEGNLEQELKDLICSYRLDDRVTLKGSTNDISHVLESADIFALPSDFEGLPNALMEAMAAGVPCVSTDCPCGGPKMLIENNKNGLLVSVGDTIAMSNALASLLDNENLKSIFGTNAKQTANIFKPEIIYNQWRKYIDLIAGK